jgi:hypothetical protein
VLGLGVPLTPASAAVAKTMQKCWAKTILLIQNPPYDENLVTWIFLFLRNVVNLGQSFSFSFFPLLAIYSKKDIHMKKI